MIHWHQNLNHQLVLVIVVARLAIVGRSNCVDSKMDEKENLSGRP